MICCICSKDIDEKSRDACESCRREFHIECGKVEATEDTFPGSCPGVYWCIICRTQYHKEAKGHIFQIADHDNHSDLLTYAGINTTNGAFADRCSKCGMWAYEFRSKTATPGKYEGVPCGDKIRETDNGR
jgi:hypothetical protein